MSDAGKIQGEKLTDLFRQVIDRKTIMSMHVVGTGFERLATIIGIVAEQKNNFLIVDRPKGFTEAAKQLPWHLRFNFNGPDRLEYIFDTEGGESAGTDLKVPFPDFVERLQRRKNFRINTPVGSRLMFSAGELKGTIKLINISAGGAFGVLFRHNAKAVKGSVLSKDQVVGNIAIDLPADKNTENRLIIIRRAEVRRIEHDPVKKMYRYAFEFTDIEKEEKKKLVQSIYYLQRQYLQRR